MTSDTLSNARNLSELTLYSPVDLAYIATINWLFWHKPAGATRRTIVVAVQLGIGWWYVKEIGHLPIVVLGYGSLLLTQTLVALVLKLPGWRSDVRLLESSDVSKTITISEIQQLTTAVAVLSFLAVKSTSSLEELMEALITTIGFGVVATLIQKAFIATRYNLLWMSLALGNSLFIIGVITAKRIIERSMVAKAASPSGQKRVLGIDLGNWLAGIDVVASTTVFFVMVSMVPALVAWSIVQTRGAKKRQEKLEKALAELKAQKVANKERTT